MDQKYSSSLSSACSSSKKGSSNNRANLTSHNASTKKSSTKKSKKSSDANNNNISIKDFSSQTTKSSKSIFDTHNKTFREPLLHDTTIDSDYNNENNVSTLDKTMQTRIFDPCCDGDAACSRDDVDQRSEEGLKIDQNNNFTASLENHNNNNNQRTSVQIDNQSNLVSGCQDDILLIDEIRR